MKYRATLSVIALNMVFGIAASTGANAASIAGGSLAAANAAKAGDGSMTLVATGRHHSSALVVHCHRIHNRYRREECLGSIVHHHKAPRR
jgi:hypothetical protein